MGTGELGRKEVELKGNGEHEVVLERQKNRGRKSRRREDAEAGRKSWTLEMGSCVRACGVEVMSGYTTGIGLAKAYPK